MITPMNFKTDYKLYKQLLKANSKRIGNTIDKKVTIVPTSKKLCRQNGIQQELNNSLNTADYIKTVYLMMKNKGYKLPNLYIDEAQLPRKYNLSGLQSGNWNIFGPGRLEVSSPSLVIHEVGHYLHNKNMAYNQALYSMFNTFRGIFRPHLNKNEKKILTEDFKRAYQGGYFNDLELNKCLEKGYIDKETLDKFYETPEKFLVKNAFTNVEEFIAEYFTLAAQGFKFSPEITKRYKAFHGPEIKEQITREDINNLVQYRKKLEKRNVLFA